MSSKTSIITLSDDIVLQILYNLEEDPRHWARLACVCTKFSSLIRHICCKSKCYKTIPSVTSDLLSSSSSTSSSPPGGWSSLHKLSVCCPGLHHAGILLENSDFGLERELGPDETYPIAGPSDISSISPPPLQNLNLTTPAPTTSSDCSWSLYDDLYFDTVYDVSEKEQPLLPDVNIKVGVVNKKRKMGSSNNRSVGSHMASGVGNLCREQGNKLLASRFRDDCLYICDWPGCVHTEEKRSYMLFRGMFKDFKKSQVWRTINDGRRSRITLDCAFCDCKETWDLHSSFCLRRVFGYHDNGEPVVRAYVCENGHVSGAWTDRPMYS